MVNYDHLHSKTKEVINKSDHERLMFMSQPVWLNYDNANILLERMERIMKYPIYPRVESLLVIGESNSGKTSIANQFFKLHGETYIDEFDEPHMPVLLFDAPANPDPDLVYLKILETLLVEDGSRGKKGRLEKQATDVMKRRHVKMLIIDEIHNLYACATVKQRQIMNHIKSLCNSLKIPIVAFGTEDALNILHHDKQHQARFGVAELPSWGPNSSLQQFLVNFESILPLRKKSSLYQEDMSKAIWACTKGSTGAIKHLLVACAQNAIQEGTEQITLKDINEYKKYLTEKPDRGIWDVQFR